MMVVDLVSVVGAANLVSMIDRAHVSGSIPRMPRSRIDSSKNILA